MRCHICNKDMHDNEVKQDPDREQGKLLPCSDCLTEIEETLSTYKDPVPLDFYEEVVQSWKDFFGKYEKNESQ